MGGMQKMTLSPGDRLGPDEIAAICGFEEAHEKGVVLDARPPGRVSPWV